MIAVQSDHNQRNKVYEVQLQANHLIDNDERNEIHYIYIKLIISFSLSEDILLELLCFACKSTLLNEELHSIFFFTNILINWSLPHKVNLKHFWHTGSYPIHFKFWRAVFVPIPSIVDVLIVVGLIKFPGIFFCKAANCGLYVLEQMLRLEKCNFALVSLFLIRTLYNISFTTCCPIIFLK